MERIPITKQGLEKLREELNRLETIDRPKNIKAITEARGHGDISENAEYHAAKDRQSFLEGRINELKSIMGKSEVIELDNQPSDCVEFGRTVVLYNLETDQEEIYQLLGPYESDPENAKISVTSPLGRALTGKVKGEEVQARTPGGVKEYEIVEIR